MAYGFRRTGRAAAAAACIAIGDRPAIAAETLHLDVVVYDEVAVPATVMANARDAAARILLPVDVALSWLDAGSARCKREAMADASDRRAFLASLHTIRVVAGDAAITRDAPSVRSLGFSVPGTRNATLFYSAIEQRAREAGGRLAVVLGHVMAHELGYLLLGSGSHTASGLMPAQLDVRLAEQGRLRFTAAESRTIRARLLDDARLRAPANGTTIPARLRPGPASMCGCGFASLVQCLLAPPPPPHHAQNAWRGPRSAGRRRLEGPVDERDSFDEN